MWWYRAGPLWLARCAPPPPAPRAGQGRRPLGSLRSGCWGRRARREVLHGVGRIMCGRMPIARLTAITNSSVTSTAAYTHSSHVDSVRNSTDFQNEVLLVLLPLQNWLEMHPPCWCRWSSW